MKTNKLAPSILSADYANFESELKKLEASDCRVRSHQSWWTATLLPNISFGAGVVASNASSHSKLVFDCHLMVTNLSNISRKESLRGPGRYH